MVIAPPISHISQEFFMLFDRGGGEVERERKKHKEGMEMRFMLRFQSHMQESGEKKQWPKI